MANVPLVETGASRSDSIVYKTPPYIPFSAFLMALDALELGIPEQIEASLWPSLGRTLASRVVSTLEFLNFVDNKGAPQTKLLDLLNRAHRKEALRTALIDSYRGLHEIDLSSASAADIERILGGGRVNGETHRKAVRFLLQAAKFVGLPLSPALKKGIRYHQLRKDRSVSTPRTEKERATVRATERTVRLRSGGGDVSLVVRFDPARVSSEDREFLLRLIDEISAYNLETTRRRKEDEFKEDQHNRQQVNDEIPF